MTHEPTFKMHLYYYRNRWRWFTKPLIKEYVAQAFRAIPVPHIVKARRRRRKTQGLVFPRHYLSALLAALLLIVAPNTALTHTVASAAQQSSNRNQTLTATGVMPPLNMDAIYKPQFIYPVGHVTIASPFGWRVAPCAGCSSNHDGVDFHVPEGTPIYAATTGTVIFTGWKSGLGYHIVIDDGHGYVTYYGHMIDGSIPANIGVGAHVTMGDLVGLVGCTGQCTGAHLHFGLQDEGVFVDPMPVLERYAP